MARSPGPEHFLRLAIEEAVRRTGEGHGGPFGALVVENGTIVAVGWNAVTSLNDPTAHAEVQAIRAACKILGRFQLDTCELYASCEPCPMCLGAIYWARPRAVFYAATREEAARAGFDDALIYDEIGKAPGERRIPMVRLLEAEAARPFEAWASNPRRVRY